MFSHIFRSRPTRILAATVAAIYLGFGLKVAIEVDHEDPYMSLWSKLLFLLFGALTGGFFFFVGAVEQLIEYRQNHYFNPTPRSSR